MTVQELAKQAGANVLETSAWTIIQLNTGDQTKFLERFAELVRQDERETCAKLCDHWASYGAPAAEACAESIRARSKHD